MNVSSVVVVPGWLADVSVPDVVCQDALGLVLQQLHAPGVHQSSCLWLEEHNSLQTTTLCGVRGDFSKPDVQNFVKMT